MAKIFISFNVVTTSDVILVVREVSAPLAEIFRQFYAAPHTQRNLTVTPVNPVMHRVQVWTTTDGVTLGLLIGQCDIDASLNTSVSFDVVTFIVDRGLTGTPHYDPVTPTNQYVNPDLDGKTYMVFKPGYGPLIWGFHIAPLAGGGFVFINGQDFSSGEEYTIMVSNIVQTSTLSSGAGYPEDVVAITGNIALNPAHLNKLLEVNGSGIITITADISTIMNNKTFGINNHNGTQRYVGLTLASGQYILVNGVQKNTIWIGRGETVQLIKKGGYLRVVNDWQGYRLLGSRVKGDSATKPWNGLLAVGGWLLKTDYPRVWEYIQSLGVEALSIADDTVIVTADRAIWHYGATKIWVPDYGGYFERNYDPDANIDTTGGTRTPGQVQGDMVGPHNHGIPVLATTDTGTGAIVGGNPVGPDAAVNTDNNLGIETRPKNLSAYTYIIG